MSYKTIAKYRIQTILKENTYNTVDKLESESDITTYFKDRYLVKSISSLSIVNNNLIGYLFKSSHYDKILEYIIIYPSIRKNLIQTLVNNIKEQLEFTYIIFWVLLILYSHSTYNCYSGHDKKIQENIFPIIEQCVTSIVNFSISDAVLALLNIRRKFYSNTQLGIDCGRKFCPILTELVLTYAVDADVSISILADNSFEIFEADRFATNII